VLSVSPRLTYQAAGQALVATDHKASASRPCSLCTHHPRRKRGCRGFTGPVPPPLLMSARISDKPVCRQGLPERPLPDPLWKACPTLLPPSAPLPDFSGDSDLEDAQPESQSQSCPSYPIRIRRRGWARRRKLGGRRTLL
jgi:hypothetical protein